LPKQIEALNLTFAASKKKNKEEDDEKMEATETCKLTKYDENQRNTHA
jgi:hypothetical protein